MIVRTTTVGTEAGNKQSASITALCTRSLNSPDRSTRLWHLLGADGLGPDRSVRQHSASHIAAHASITRVCMISVHVSTLPAHVLHALRVQSNHHLVQVDHYDGGNMHGTTGET